MEYSNKNYFLFAMVHIIEANCEKTLMKYINKCKENIFIL
ncbi:hypothetical protein N581_03630 [Lactobacillus jensenii MD IIE-70(2)]|nr:hypothetical protein N581_03630 [Lactobacillus jensenii MD IIE-70(2)]